MVQAEEYHWLQHPVLGGGIINSAFEIAGMLDELSLGVAPTVAGKNCKPLFMNADIANLGLIKAETENGNLVLNYNKKRKSIGDGTQSSESLQEKTNKYRQRTVSGY